MTEKRIRQQNSKAQIQSLAVRFVVAVLVGFLGIVAIGIASIRLDAAYMGVRVNWSNEIVSLSGPSAHLWGLALTIIGAVIIACLWPNRKTATGAIPPLISALIFLGFVILGNTERTQGMLNSVSTGQAADINGPVPGSEDGTFWQWLLAGAISPATFALIGVMLGLGAYVLVTSRKVQ